MSISGNCTNEQMIKADLYSDIFRKALQACAIGYLSRALSYPAGLAYGGLTGVIQLLFSGIHQKIDEKTSSLHAKKLNYMISVCLPWALSGIILRQIYKNTENARITSDMGLVIALIQQVIGRSNLHLLPKDPPHLKDS